MTKYDKDGNMIITDSEGNEITILMNYKNPLYEEGTFGCKIEDSDKVVISGRRQKVARSETFQKAILYLSKIFLVEKKDSIEKRLLPPEIQRYAEMLVQWEFLVKNYIHKDHMSYVLFVPAKNGEYIFLQDYCDYVMQLRSLMRYGQDD